MWKKSATNGQQSSFVVSASNGSMLGIREIWVAQKDG